jgi:hypothetical protein
LIFLSLLFHNHAVRREATFNIVDLVATTAGDSLFSMTINVGRVPAPP